MAGRGNAITISYFLIETPIIKETLTIVQEVCLQSKCITYVRIEQKCTCYISSSTKIGYKEILFKDKVQRGQSLWMYADIVE